MFSCCAEPAGGEIVIEGTLEQVKVIPPAKSFEEPLKAVEPEVKEEAAAEAPKVEEPAPAKPGMKIEFSTGPGEENKFVLEVTEKPLGISFANLVPIVVKRVEDGTQAKTFGVEKDWVFNKIDGVSLEGVEYKAVIDMLKKGMEPLPQVDGKEAFPPGAFVIEFATGSPESRRTKKVAFITRPLDITFTNTVPITIKRCTGQAVKLGVQEGWTITTAGNKDLTGLDYNAALNIIKAGSAGLPEDVGGV